MPGRFGPSPHRGDGNRPQLDEERGTGGERVHREDNTMKSQSKASRSHMLAEHIARPLALAGNAPISCRRVWG
jgi:hypothetical protein